MSPSIAVHKLKAPREEGLPLPACMTNFSIPHRIRLATGISPTLQHPSAGVTDDHAVQAGALPPIGVSLHRMATLAQRLEYRWSDTPLSAHQAGMVGRREAGVREAIAIEAR